MLNDPTNLIDPLGLGICDRNPNAPACTHEVRVNDAVGDWSTMTCMMDGIPANCTVVSRVLNAGSGGTTVRNIGGFITISATVSGWEIVGCLIGSCGSEGGVFIIDLVSRVFSAQFTYDPAGMYNNFLRRRREASNRVPTPEEYIQAIADAMPTLLPSSQDLKLMAVRYACGSSPGENILTWMEFGASKGAVGGLLVGIPDLGIPPGSPLGGYIGFHVGMIGGAVGGMAASGACSALGVYGK